MGESEKKRLAEEEREKARLAEEEREKARLAEEERNKAEAEKEEDIEDVDFDDSSDFDMSDDPMDLPDGSKTEATSDTVSELPKKQPAVEESEASFLDESVAEDSFTESFIEEKA